MYWINCTELYWIHNNFYVYILCCVSHYYYGNFESTRCFLSYRWYFLTFIKKHLILLGIFLRFDYQSHLAVLQLWILHCESLIIIWVGYCTAQVTPWHMLNVKIIENLVLFNMFRWCIYYVLFRILAGSFIVSANYHHYL